MMKPLTIRADELVMAFEDNSPGVQWYLDVQTGEVFPIFEDNAEEEDLERLEAEPKQFLEIDPMPSRVGCQIMWDFVETLREGTIRQELERALDKKHPFRRFKDVLLNYPDTQEDWFRFHEQAFMSIIQEWLADQGLEITLEPFHK